VALANGPIAHKHLADAFLMEALEITSWTDLEATPELVLQYRLEIRQEQARRRAALAPRNTGA